MPVHRDIPVPELILLNCITEIKIILICKSFNLKQSREKTIFNNDH